MDPSLHSLWLYAYEDMGGNHVSRLGRQIANQMHSDVRMRFCTLQVKLQTIENVHRVPTRSQSSDNEGSFSSDLGPFQGLKIGVPHGYLGETSIFKIINLLAIWFK